MSVQKTNITTTTTSKTTQTKTEKKEQTEKKNIFKTFGSWFNRNSDKIGQSMTILGDTAMNVGSNFANLEMQKAMLKSCSIWCMSSYGMMGMGGMGFFGGRDYSSWYMNGDPLGVSWMGGAGGFNPYYTQMGANMAYNWGASLVNQELANSYPQGSPYIQSQNQTQITNTQQQVNDIILEDENNEFADLDVSKQKIEEGKKFDEATDKLAKGNNKFSLGVTKGKDGKVAENYKSRVSEIGKSYVAHIEKTVTDDEVDNQGIDLEEFKSHEMAKLGDDVSDEKREQAEQRAENAFKKLDINGDKEIDWKEYSAAIMTFDQDSGTDPKGSKPTGATNDGQITSTDYKKWSTLMAQDSPNLFDISVRRNYKELFDESQDE